MKCKKCGSEVKPNYKFCTKCGNPMEGMTVTTDANDNHIRKNSVPLDSSNKKGFGTGIPTKGMASKDVQNISNEVEMVKGKAVWNISPGQIARRISESEFAQLDDLKGIVIQEGVSTVIAVDGKIVGLLQGGYYEFATKEIHDRAQAAAEKDEQDEKETEGLLQKAGSVARRVWRFFTGSKVNGRAEEHKLRKERIRKHIQSITSQSVVNVTLVNNKHFELLFGSIIGSDGNSNFVPMTIRTKLVDVSMGVSVKMQVTDIHELLSNYLTDKNRLSIVDLQNMLQPSIENVLNSILRNFDYQSKGLPDVVISNLKDSIKQIVNERLFGIEITQVLDITDQSDDFERFREVERNLFLSEQEYEYLQRTGEFRNRLTIEANAQEIQQAKNDEDLRYSLEKINKDKLLHEDEMEAFVELLNSQKRLREAKTEEQEYEVLQELKKCRLIKDDDVEVLRNALYNKALEREEASELLRIRIYRQTEESRVLAENALSNLNLDHKHKQENLIQEHEQASDISAAQHNVEMTDLGLQARQKVDDYNRSQNIQDYEFGRQQQLDDLSMSQQRALFEQQLRRNEKFDDLDILERKVAMSRQNMQVMQDHERALESEKRKIEALRIEKESMMTKEQLLATHIQDMSNLDSEAQKEMARVMGASRDKEADMLREQQAREREMYEMMLKMQENAQMGDKVSAAKTQELMAQMAQMMMNGMAQMGQNVSSLQNAQIQQQQNFQQQRLEDAIQMKQEYRENAFHQQERMDHTQDSALNYTSKVTEAVHNNDSKITIETGNEYGFCPECCCRVSINDDKCPKCGTMLK